MEMVLMLVMVKMVLETLPYTKEELVTTMAAIFRRRRPRDSRICPLPRWKKTFASAAASENYQKNMA
jgi:hypothetical protein